VCIINKEVFYYEGSVWFLSSVKTLFDLLKKNKNSDENINNAYNILKSTGDIAAIEDLRNKRVHFCTERIKNLQKPKVETFEIVPGVTQTGTDLDFQDYYSTTSLGLDAKIGCRVSVDKWLRVLRQIQPLLEAGAVTVQAKYGYDKLQAPNAMVLSEFVKNNLRETELTAERMCGLK
jgi:hypothetical protein